MSKKKLEKVMKTNRVKAFCTSVKVEKVKKKARVKRFYSLYLWP